MMKGGFRLTSSGNKNSSEDSSQEDSHKTKTKMNKQTWKTKTKQIWRTSHSEVAIQTTEYAHFLSENFKVRKT